MARASVLRGAAFGLVSAAALAFSGCGGSTRAADAEWDLEVHDEKPHRYREEITLNPTPIDKTPPAMLSAFIGVRHDLMLADTPKSAQCSCLAVEVGPPSDPAFFWQGDKPKIGVEAMVVAIGAQGIACPGGDPVEARRRPSISAVDLENADVVIEVEDLPFGRPLASGAIVPKPGAGGSLLIRPRNAHTIYGRGPSGERCRVR